MEFDYNRCETPALAKIDSMHFLCAYDSDGDEGWARLLGVNEWSWSAHDLSSYMFEPSKANYPALAKIDDGHVLCVYATDGDVGVAEILRLGPEVLP
jgi:hypothetical protein